MKTKAALHPSIYELSCGVDAVILSIAEEEGDLGGNDSWSVGTLGRFEAWGRFNIGTSMLSFLHEKIFIANYCFEHFIPSLQC